MTQQKSFDSGNEIWLTTAERRLMPRWEPSLNPVDRAAVWSALADIARQNRLNGQKANPYTGLVPVRIQKNGPAMIVFWRDGTKTIVRRGEDEPDSDYAAFTAALGIKCFGSNSALKRIVDRTEPQKPKKQKQTENVIDRHDEPVTEEEVEQKSETLNALKSVAEKFGMTAEEAFQKIKEAQKDNNG